MPCLWSAWLELASIMTQLDRVLILDRLSEHHWMKNFFVASYHLDAHQERDSITISNTLLKYFPTSVFLKN